MKRTAFALLLAALAPPAAAQTAPKHKSAPALRLERVVMMMRHGIRPPTKANPGARRCLKETLLGGYDTNIADLGGFFRVHWKVPS